MPVYYNENDPKAAAWIRELMNEGHIAEGDIDERSIEDIVPNELRKYAQCHFFAGIAVWSHALRNIGWPDDRPVWTGSCPCQPFSAAGKGEGFTDERHLWPAWFHLIDQLRPVAVIGEQVSSKDILPWFDLVSDDLEGAGYTVRPLDIPACSVGAFHIRQRLYFVADTKCGRLEKRNAEVGIFRQSNTHRELSIVAESDSQRRHGERLRVQPRESRSENLEVGRSGEASIMADSDGGDEGAERQQRGGEQRQFAENSRVSELVDANGRRLQIGRSDGETPDWDGRNEDVRPTTEELRGSGNSFWSDAEWLYCRDGKYRPVKPGIFPVANGIAGRVGLLRGAGNAIVPQVAEAFIESWLAEIEGE